MSWARRSSGQDAETERASQILEGRPRDVQWRSRAATLGRNRWVTTLLGLIAAVVVWQVVAVAVGDPVFVPLPTDTAAVWWRYMNAPFPALGEPLWMHTAVSLGRVLLGFALGSIVGILVAAAMISFRPLRGMVDPLIELSRPLPPIAFIPLLIVWFGIGETPKVVLIMFGVVPVVAISTVAAFDKVPVEMIHTARSLGASDRYATVHVRLRAAAPHIFTGLRLAMGISWGSIVASEMIAATSGLGYVVLQAGVYLRTDLIFAGILCIALMGILLDSILRALQRRLDPSQSA